MKNEIFIKKSIKIHGLSYDYSLIEYKNNATKVKIICHVHGMFEQTPNSHLSGSVCPKCNIDKKTNSMNYFIEKSNKTHKYYYDYSLVEYVNSYTKIKIICPIHSIIEQTPNKHLNGHGCIKCFYESKKLSIEQFIEKSNMIHSNKYDYSKTIYIDSRINVIIKCPIHEFFDQKPKHHLQGKGCPKCGNIRKRLDMIKRIEENYNNGYQITPNFNKDACNIFNKIMIKENIHIQHAMNGGEYHIKELGYWLDGYDKENNIVYEFDEKYHENIKQKEKDIIRQKEIEEYLKCYFIRIKSTLD